MVTRDGRVKILDFGLAKLIEPAPRGDLDETPGRRPHRGGACSGRRPTCRRNRRAGKTVDARSDIFSFGAVLYQMVTGRTPFAAGRARRRWRRFSTRIRSRRVASSSVAAEIETAIMRCLRKDPARRYQTMAD